MATTNFLYEDISFVFDDDREHRVFVPSWVVKDKDFKDTEAELLFNLN